MIKINRENISIVFMGTPVFALESLKSLVDAGFNVKCVVTKEDKKIGRGMKVSMTPVKEYSLENNIEVITPKSLKNEEVVNYLKDLNPDIIAVTAYGKILPKSVLDIPKIGCINVHGSLLPKYRGSAPMQYAIINGDKKTGITTMFMDVGMDTGDMLLKEEVEILENDNLKDIHDKMMMVGGKLLVETIDKLAADEITGIPQGDDFTLAPMITKDMEKLDFNKSNIEVKNYVRGLTPFPSVYSKLKGKMYKFIEVEAIDKEYNAKCGEIVDLNNSLIVQCKKGCISVLKIKPEGKKTMDIKDFLNGNKLSIGDVFSND